MMATSDTEIATATSGCVNLSACIKYVTVEGVYRSVFDFDALQHSVRLLTQTLEQTIDRGYYPETVPEIRAFAVKHRPIVVGVHGLADVFAMLQLPWESEAAQMINYQIAEAVYYASTHESMVLAQRRKSYTSFPNSPLFKGLLSQDTWIQEEISRRCEQPRPDGTVDVVAIANEIGARYARYARVSPEMWDALRTEIKVYGVRHSLRTGCIADVSSAAVMDCSPGREPVGRCIQADLFDSTVTIPNRYMIVDMKSGSSPLRVEQIYKSPYEIRQSVLLRYAIDAGRFVDHAEPRQLYLRQPTINVLTTYLFQAWLGGIKTALYRLRT